MRLSLTASLLFFVAACGGGAPQGGPGRGTESPRPPRRLLVIGWDGADFDEIDRLAREGGMENLTALAKRGVEARLASTVIPISSAAWPAAVTGRGPGETGVFSFFEPVPGSYDVRLISSRSNHAAPIWRLLTARGIPSLVFGVPITYPPEPILGTMVSGMLSPFDAVYTWPPELTETLRRRGFEPDLDTWVEARPVGWEDVDRQLRIKEEVLLELLEREDWAFAMVVFKSLDVMSHLSYGVDFHAQMGPLYERLDAILGTLVAKVGPGTDVIVLSDHGFHVYGAGMNLTAWLEAEGFSVPKEHRKRFTIREDEPLGRRERLEIRKLRDGLDWSKTRAFATRSEGNFGSIRLNVAGREPSGCVAPEERGALLDEIEARLRSFRDPGGVGVVTNVWRSESLYPGPFAETLPDLLFETVPECQVFSDPDEERIAGNYGLGVPDHRRSGIFLAAGPSFRAIDGRGDVEIRDLAPTVLFLLDQSVPEGMSGEALARFTNLERAVRFVPDEEDPLLDASREMGAAPFTEEELRVLEQRLQGLGYGR
ncbi:MAG TPA: hypothetical protein ENJ09_11865 [Planctomycetes bacterium]|nr:hypothetical protein [Planctomycetota bacterium]